MNTSPQTIHELFTNAGAEFLSTAENIQQRLSRIKAFVFDWDGVFNNAQKGENGSSFNEADSMGTNMLRFSHFIQTQKIPQTAVISGERNPACFLFTRREHFDASYYKVGNKIIAFDHFCMERHISPEEICYFFDDVLDLSIAKVCGLRILINRKPGLLFKQYVRENKLADYITANDGGNYAIREVCEMLIGLSGTFDTALTQRIEYDMNYKNYLDKKNTVDTIFYTLKDAVVIGDTTI